MTDKTTATDVDLARETSLGTIAKFATLLVGFVGSIIFARLLGPAGYGAFFLALSLVEIVEKGAQGWASASKKRFSEDVTEEYRKKVVGGAIAGLITILFAGVVVTWLFSDHLEAYTGVEGTTIPVILLIIAMVSYTTFKELLDARGLVGISNWGEALQTLFAFPIQLGLVIAGFGVTGMLFGYSIGFFLVIPIIVYYVGVHPAIPSTDVVSRIWSFAKYSTPSGLLGRVYTRVDVIILGLLLGQAAAGYYEAAYRITIPATFVSAVAAPALMSRTSNLSSRNEAFSDDVRNTLSYSSILALPIFFGALVLSNELVVTIYGPEYAQAALLLVGLAFYRVVSSQLEVLLNVIQGVDRPDIFLRLSVVTIAVNVPLGVVLTLEFGPIGVVISTIIAESMRYVGSLNFVRNWVDISDLLPKQIGQQVVASAVMAATVWTALRFLTVRAWPVLVFLLALGAVVYATVLLAVSVQHRRLVADVVTMFGVDFY
ncbi:lipopolysaccharide biosynthesis protein [Haloferax sp. S1W]|uniref:lipopolysaccharide biosynthesis protein n=1 Tax=Haloferax sp. S1W TaxID=3377110 RepID=UPI0037C8C8C1